MLLDLLAHSSTTPIGLSSAKQIVISKALNVKMCYLIFTSKDILSIEPIIVTLESSLDYIKMQSNKKLRIMLRILCIKS